MMHVGGVLHSTAERPIVLYGRVVNAYGGIPFVHISNPGNAISKCACCGWVLEGLIMKNLRKKHHEKQNVNLENAVKV